MSKKITLATEIDTASTGRYASETVVVPSIDVYKLSDTTIQSVLEIAENPAVITEVMLNKKEPEVVIERVFFDRRIPPEMCFMYKPRVKL